MLGPRPSLSPPHPPPRGPAPRASASRRRAGPRPPPPRAALFPGGGPGCRASHHRALALFPGGGPVRRAPARLSAPRAPSPRCRASHHRALALFPGGGPGRRAPARLSAPRAPAPVAPLFPSHSVCQPRDSAGRLRRPPVGLRVRELMLRPAAALLRSLALALVVRSPPPPRPASPSAGGSFFPRLLVTAPLDAACSASALGAPRASADSLCPPPLKGGCARGRPFRPPPRAMLHCHLLRDLCQQSLLFGVSLPRQMPRVLHRVSAVRRHRIVPLSCNARRLRPAGLRPASRRLSR